MAESVRINFYDLFSSVAEILLNNSIFVICNLEIILYIILYQRYINFVSKLSFLSTYR